MNVYTIEIDPREIKLLEQNARYMKHEEFALLVENVRRDGKLTSTPFLVLDDDGKYLCLSGNHRTRAAIEAGLKTIIALATDTELSHEQRIAIQLSHNAISGQDDPATLKLLYEQIYDTSLKQYSGLDDKTLELLEQFPPISISEANLQFQILYMVFLPEDLKAAQAILEQVKQETKNADAVWLARMSEYDAWLEAQELVGASNNVKNVATIVDLMLRFIEKNMDKLSEAWEDTDDDSRWVPIETVIGKSKIPAGAAKTIKKALDRMVSLEDITSKNLWQGLEYLAADYLAGD